MNRQKPEILAPGGSVESIYSAINAGCDAIYAGGKRFGARAFARNEDNDRLIDILNDIHLAGKKLYLTVNTVLTEHEIGQLYDYLCPLYENGLDAVIVQDLGVLRFIHKEFPDIDIHASTQMSITGAGAANLLMPYGVTRVVPARELSLEELMRLRQGTGAELEVFVHGALCSSYSGQCLMSSLIGGRSGNRGACAQPCRKQYSMNDGNPDYVLSLKDLCTIDIIPELVRCGIDSFKIEGRMKKPEYTALTTHMYRKYLDKYYELGDEDYRSLIESDEYRYDMRELRDIYNRGGFTNSYLVNNLNSDSLLSGNRPNHEGIIVGYVDNVGKNSRVNIRYTKEVNKGDILEIRNDSGVKVHDYTLGDGSVDKNSQVINPGYNYKLISKGMKVYRVRNNSLITGILSKYPALMGKLRVRGKLTAHIGECLQLLVMDERGNGYTASGGIVLVASKHAADETLIKSKVMVSGDSVYTWDELELDIDEGIFLSASELKDIRRRALSGLEECVIDRYRRNEPVESKGEGICGWRYVQSCNIPGGVIAECYNTIHMDMAIDSKKIDTLYIHGEIVINGTVIDSHGKPYYIVLPRIIRSEHIYAKYMDMINNLQKEDDSFVGIVVCTLEQIARYKEMCIRLGLLMNSYDNIYVRNSSAAMWLREEGISGMAASVEMSVAEIDEMMNKLPDNSAISVMIYGKPAAMITAWTPGTCGIIYDGFNNRYNVLEHEEYMEILNYEPLVRDIDNNIDHRIVLSDENQDDINKVFKGL